jgi:hypothetical protein
LIVGGDVAVFGKNLAILNAIRKTFARAYVVLAVRECAEGKGQGSPSQRSMVSRSQSRSPKYFYELSYAKKWYNAVKLIDRRRGTSAIEDLEGPSDILSTKEETRQLG